jgi:hypothetical protein
MVRSVSRANAPIRHLRAGDRSSRPQAMSLLFDAAQGSSGVRYILCPVTDDAAET